MCNRFFGNSYFLFAILFFQCCFDSSLIAQTEMPDTDWPQWRGPNRDNKSLDVGLTNQWSNNGPPLIWHLENIGHGIGPVVVQNGRAITVGAINDSQYVLAIDAKTGKGLWATHIGKYANFEQRNRLFKSMRWVTQRCPTLDGERLYFLGDNGQLVCLDTATGKEIWRRGYQDDFEAKPFIWGFCDYPLVDQDRLICTPAGEKTTVVALDTQTGETIWSYLVPELKSRSYCATLQWKINDKNQYITCLGQSFVGINAADGSKLWSCDYVNRVAKWYTPILTDRYMFVPSGYGQKLSLYQFSQDNGKISVKPVYEKMGIHPQQFHDSSVILGEDAYLYNRGRMFRIDWRTSETKDKPFDLETRRYTSFCYADQKLYCRGEDGLITMLRIENGEIQRTGRFIIPNPEDGNGATHPVIAGGRLYIRDDDQLLCYDVRSNESSKGTKEKIVQFNPLLTKPSDHMETNKPAIKLDAPFVATPKDVARKMLELAGVSKEDVVYDLGSGDGVILMEAAKKYGCRCLGVELDKDLVDLSRKRIKEAKLDRLITIVHGDLFKQNLTNATVITSFLYPDLMKKLIPQLKQMKGKGRWVSHQFALPDIKPDRTINMQPEEGGAERPIYLWNLPLDKQDLDKDE